MIRSCLAAAAALCLIVLAIPAGAEEPAPKVRMLMLTQSAGYRHGSVTRDKENLSPAEVAVTQLAQESELFKVDCTQDAALDFTKENLEKYDLVFFYTTGNLPIPEEAKAYFYEEWLKKKGHGFIGAHSATDTFHEDKRYWDMIGGTFNGHPWGAGTTVTITVHDQDHPASKPWGEEFQIKDEIYQYKNWQPEKVRVLMSLNMAKCEPKQPYMVPISWVKEYGEGRVFYTNLGHNAETWANPKFIKSLENGIRWTLRLEEGSGKPNPDVSAAQEAKSKKDAGK